MVRLRFETDLGTTLRAGNDLNAVFDRVGDTVQGTVREMNALEKAAKRLIDQTLTPTERYNQKLETMAKAVKAGKMSMEDAERTAARLRGQLEQTGSVGGRAFSLLSDKLLAFASAASAISIVTRTLQEMDAQAVRSADSVASAIGSFGELQQVATSPEDFRKLVGQARGFVRQGVFGESEKGAAADLVFNLRNAGYTDSEVQFITKLGTSRQVKKESLSAAAEGLKKAQNVFGRNEAGSIEQIGNKLFVAANAMQTDFAKAAVASTLFGSEAKALGFSDEEALAAFVAIEQQSPGTEEAATRLRSMLTQIQKKKLGKGSMRDTVADLAQRVKRGESAIDILGETRAAAGLNILAGLEGQDVFAQMQREIGAANSQDIIGSRRFLEADPILASADARLRQQGKEADTFENLDATSKNLTETVLSARRERAKKMGEIPYFLHTTAESLIGWANTEQMILRGEQRGGFQNVDADTARQINEYLRQISENTNTDLKAPKPSGRQEN